MLGMSDLCFVCVVIVMCSYDVNGVIGIGLGVMIDGLGFYDFFK